jgi:transposase
MIQKIVLQLCKDHPDIRTPILTTTGDEDISTVTWSRRVGYMEFNWDTEFTRRTANKLSVYEYINVIMTKNISKETLKYLKTKPSRFNFTFTPKHASWLNIIEVFFSKMTRTVLRGIRVKSLEELKDRLNQYFNEINIKPIKFRWKYRMDEI